jgi:hypothetical protein
MESSHAVDATLMRNRHRIQDYITELDAIPAQMCHLASAAMTAIAEHTLSVHLARVPLNASQAFLASF